MKIYNFFNREVALVVILGSFLVSNLNPNVNTFSDWATFQFLIGLPLAILCGIGFGYQRNKPQ